ncbi:unnamed protein product [Acanthocheilonema viteae]|uniref:Uncharacterized protein n=1 Tax=Acanthocheilonema viteae TaxID=6277 RepID=A0A498SAI8_ACAVI|nr:unnamed protein product [Acanthocheilonema viteae]
MIKEFGHTHQKYGFRLRHFCHHEGKAFIEDDSLFQASANGTGGTFIAFLSFDAFGTNEQIAVVNCAGNSRWQRIFTIGQLLSSADKTND